MLLVLHPNQQPRKVISPLFRGFPLGQVYLLPLVNIAYVQHVVIFTTIGIFFCAITVIIVLLLAKHTGYATFAVLAFPAAGGAVGAATGARAYLQKVSVDYGSDIVSANPHLKLQLN